jgi:hypothetical protein
MKEKLIIVIITLILAITMSACRKETNTTETDVIKETIEPTQSEELEENSTEITSEPTNSDSTSTDESAEDDTNTSNSSNENNEAGDLDKSDETVCVDNPIEEGDVFTNPVVMSTPPFSYYKSENAPDKKSEIIKLEMTKSKTNNITDEAEWFLNNNLSSNIYQLPISSQISQESIPDGIDTVWDELIITKTFYDESYIYCIYGGDYSEGYILNIYDIGSLELISTFDFTNYRYSPDFISQDYDFIQQRINWATLKDNILYVSHSHNTYAYSSNNMNAYITAIDLTDMSIIWRTDALVSNSYNFLLLDDVIISGYGFTDEPDYLYQVDSHTGEVIDKIALESAPSYIVKKDNTIYVRTYNKDYEFEISK